MEDFLKIDWHPALEDMIATDFINPERLERESITYRILRGTFKDPFIDIHEDYNDLVTSDLINQPKRETAMEKNIKKKSLESNDKIASVDAKEKQQEELWHIYVPGFPNKTIRFPRLSDLTIQQQELCVKVLLKFSSSVKPEITAIDNEEMTTYMSLSPIIAKEQDEFMEYAKNNWDCSKFKIVEEEFINQMWKKKVKSVSLLPIYYTETGSIPFVSPKEIGVNYLTTCLELGKLSRVFLPSLKKRFILPMNTTKINQRFFSVGTEDGEKGKPIIFKKSVSEDANCETLAKEHGVDLVISSSGLNCLALNMDPNTKISWILPVVVKHINDKNVVFVDKPLPPTGLTAIKKNAWIYKYSLKAHVAHPFHIRAWSLDPDTGKGTRQPYEYHDWDRPKSLDNDQLKDEPEIPVESEDTDKPDEIEDEKNAFLRPPTGHNLFYKLFSIDSCGEHENELKKNRVNKTFKLLVRTKTDGSMGTSKTDEQLVMLAAKLEHQILLGAEAVTAEEAAKQWMSLIFRPHTSLARVRIAVETAEAIQIEMRTPISISNEIKRLYNLKPEAALTLLYNVTETMTAMSPGRYLIRHTVSNGAFASIYKEADGPGKNTFDLQTVYCENELRTIPNAPWPAIDKIIVTPALKHFKRMPAMFRGRKPTKAEIKKNNITQGKKNASRKPTIDGVRKSLRNRSQTDTN